MLRWPSPYVEPVVLTPQQPLLAAPVILQAGGRPQCVQVGELALDGERLLLGPCYLAEPEVAPDSQQSLPIQVPETQRARV